MKKLKFDVNHLPAKKDEIYVISYSDKINNATAVGSFHFLLFGIKGTDDFHNMCTLFDASKILHCCFEN